MNKAFQMQTRTLLLTVATSVAMTGCPDMVLTPDGPDPEPSVMEPDPMEPDVVVDEDAGVIDPPTDAGVEEGPLRTVHQRSLLGGMPLKNRFLDPWITQQAAGWVFLSGDPFSWPTVGQLHLPGTPLFAPAGHIDRSANPDGVDIFGVARSSASALSVSVWVGHDEGQPDLGELSVSLIGVYEQGADLASDLTFDLTTAPIIADGIMWKRYRATLAEGPIGWAYLHISDDADADLYFAAPVLVSVPSAGFSAAAVGPQAKRAITSREAAGLAVLRDRMRDHLSAPPVPRAPVQALRFGPTR